MFKSILKIILSVFTSVAKDITVSELNQIAVVAGKAFGPPGIVHFSELSAAEQRALTTAIPVLAKNHEDWPDAIAWIPRKVTTWIGPRPTIIDGNTDDAKPIPDHGKWFTTRGYFAMTTDSGLHVRFGFRYDDVDHYITAPSVAVKRV